MSNIKKIGVLTSGGDAPGMNAAIRAVVRSALYQDLEVMGIRRGYRGMIEGDFIPMISKDVGNIIQRGGTILGTARSKEFKTEKGRQKAYNNLQKNKVDACIVIGGDGSFTGAGIFSKEYDIPFIGIPGTIDNDLFGTDYTIGYDTALNTVVEAVDRIRDTASAHERLFFIEVMGRGAGFIALHSGIATGAEAILMPEIENQEEGLRAYLKRQNKKSNIILVAEGNHMGGAAEIAEKVKEDFKDYDVRVNVLGHIQRGGSPSAFDRFLASRLGVAAIEALLDNQRSSMVGFVNHETVLVPFNKTIKFNRNLNRILLEVADILSY